MRRLALLLLLSAAPAPAADVEVSKPVAVFHPDRAAVNTQYAALAVAGDTLFAVGLDELELHANLLDARTLAPRAPPRRVAITLGPGGDFGLNLAYAAPRPAVARAPSSSSTRATGRRCGW